MRSPGTCVMLLACASLCSLAGCFGIHKPHGLPPGDGDNEGGVPGQCVRSAKVLSGHATNARDLGGTPIDPVGAVVCGALYRGGPLADLSAEGCDRVNQLGIQTVIDLRTEGERQSVPDSACIDARVVLAPLPIPFNVSPTDYLADLNAAPSVAAAFTAFGDEAAYPIYFHCTYGRDRTGVVAAVVLRALGVSRADVMQDYLISQQTVGAYPASLEAVLDEIDRRGIESYLADSGVSAQQLEVLRARAVVR
jgi:protein tyrosine phosphatase (PTP) superfamily phosphohydrolase (DUF442 family)